MVGAGSLDVEALHKRYALSSKAVRTFKIKQLAVARFEVCVDAEHKVGVSFVVGLGVFDLEKQLKCIGVFSVLHKLFCGYMRLKLKIRKLKIKVEGKIFVKLVVKGALHHCQELFLFKFEKGRVDVLCDCEVKRYYAFVSRCVVHCTATVIATERKLLFCGCEGAVL